MRTMTIAIAGCSCSGKSTLCQAVQQRFAQGEVALLPTDQFRTPHIGEMRSPVTGQVFPDWSNPAYTDVPGILSARQQHVQNNVRAVLIEGLPALALDAIRSIADLRCFIDLPPEDRLYRRILRNMEKNGSTMQEVADYHLHSARFVEAQYCMPSRIHADLIFNGARPVDLTADLLARWIRSFA